MSLKVMQNWYIFYESKTLNKNLFIDMQHACMFIYVMHDNNIFMKLLICYVINS